MTREEPPGAGAAAESEGPAAPPVGPEKGVPDGEKATESEKGPCAGLGIPGEEWIDRARFALTRALCGSAHWFDSFFGDRRYDERRQGSFGRAGLLATWDELDGWSAKGRVRARLEFPRLESRLAALVGRGDEEDLIEDRPAALGTLPESFREATDDEWLVGLGYTPATRLRGRFDTGVGVRARFPLDPYAKASWSVGTMGGQSQLARFRQTLFWRHSYGFGSTTRLDAEHLVGSRSLLRLTNSVTWAEETEGVEWFSGLTLFQAFRHQRALAVQIHAKGETDATEPVSEYAVGVTYRQRMRRDWLFFESRPRLAWRRETPESPRKPVWGLAVGFEMRLAGSD